METDREIIRRFGEKDGRGQMQSGPCMRNVQLVESHEIRELDVAFTCRDNERRMSGEELAKERIGEG